MDGSRDLAALGDTWATTKGVDGDNENKRQGNSAFQCEITISK